MDGEWVIVNTTDLIANISLGGWEQDDDMSPASSPSSLSPRTNSSSSTSSLPSMHSSWSSIGGEDSDSTPNALEILAGIEVQAERLPEGPFRDSSSRSHRSDMKQHKALKEKPRKRKSIELAPISKRLKNTPRNARSVDEEEEEEEAVAESVEDTAAVAVLTTVGDGEVPSIGIYTKSQRAEKIRRFKEKKKNRKFNKKVRTSTSIIYVHVTSNQLTLRLCANHVAPDKVNSASDRATPRHATPHHTTPHHTTPHHTIQP
jgi:hypothetical protein